MSERADFRDYTKLLYEVVSTPSGQRDWHAAAALFHPDARMVRTGIDEAGEAFAKVMSVAEYAENAESMLQDAKFSETEIEHNAMIFGNVAQLSSVFEFCWQSGGLCREGRGVNFFTLIRNNNRWQIMSIVWDNEREGLSLVTSGITTG